MFALRLDDELELTLPEERHVDELYRLIDANRAELERFLPWARDATRDSELAFVRAGLERFAAGGGFDGALRLAGELVGMLGVFNVRMDVRRAELGYWLAAPARGRGLMGRAVAGLLPVLFDELRLERVEIRCESDNRRSRRVAERLGFRHEGTLRRVHPASGGRAADLEVFGLLRAEWEPQGKVRSGPHGHDDER